MKTVHRNKIVHFRLSTEEYERFKNAMSVKGCQNISEYLRFVALDKDILFEDLVNRTYAEVKRISKLLSRDEKIERGDLI